MRDRLRSDEGAVAVWVAIMSLLLAGMAAFAVDFGIGYTTKVNIQKAADAASLSAAGKIIALSTATDTCATLTTKWTNNTGNLRTTVVAQADAIATANSPYAVRTADMTVQCSADNKRLEVTYPTTGTNPAVFGALFGATSINSARTATADVFVPASATGLRPYAVCSTDKPTLTTAAAAYAAGTGNAWVRVNYPNPSCGNYDGNWYSLDCPNDGNNGTLDENTRNGCDSEIGIVDDTTTTTLNADIQSECANAVSGTFAPPTECLMSNPGNLTSNTLTSAWDYLMTLPAIQVPIFANSSNTYADNNVNRCKSGGNGGCYPVRAIASVKVCAYRFQNKTPSAVSTDPRCAGLTITAVKAGPNADALWLALTAPVQVTGTSGPGRGSIGDGTGLLGTRLIN